VLVVTADHGETFSVHHDIVFRGKYRTLYRHGRSIYNEVVHVPLVIAAPGQIPPGRKFDTPMTHMDLLPTVLDLAGLPLMKGARGHSLKKHLLDGTKLPARPIFSETDELMAIRLGKWRYIHRSGSSRSFRTRGGRGRMIHVTDQLFDLSVDPHETKNLARRHPERVARMRKQLFSVLKPKRAPKPRPKR
jgi:arylsulfatase A-like enzyme